LPELPSRTDLRNPFQLFQGRIQTALGIGMLPIIDKAGLMIFNCPELVERERCTDLTVSWMIQFVEV